MKSLDESVVAFKKDLRAMEQLVVDKNPIYSQRSFGATGKQSFAKPCWWPITMHITSDNL
jgi:hypothetical protein